MKTARLSRAVLALCVLPPASSAAEPPAAESAFSVNLPPHRFAGDLLPESPFGINTALRPDAPDLESRLRAMQEAGIKWGRQDFGWGRIEREKGEYAYFAFAVMTRMLEGRRWVRNDAFGPDVYAAVFEDEALGTDLIAAWSPKPYAYIRVNVTERGIDLFDIFGTRRRVTYDPVRTKSLPVPLGESPIYIRGPRGLRATPRPDPGW